MTTHIGSLHASEDGILDVRRHVHKDQDQGLRGNQRQALHATAVEQSVLIPTVKGLKRKYDELEEDEGNISAEEKGNCKQYLGRAATSYLH